MITLDINKSPPLKFRNSFADLPERFYSTQKPVPVSHPSLVMVNQNLANEFNIPTELINSNTFAEIFSGNVIIPSSKPLSMAYGGHQFGFWVPSLGDGRAHLLGEIQDNSGQWLDIQLKGSGQTIYSRGGDGRAWIGPVMREFLVSEALHMLGIPTTRALCSVATGESIARETLLPGGVVTRVAKSHVRIGTFQYYFVRNDIEGLQLLLAHTINRIYPQLKEANNPALELLKRVIEGQAQLVSKWMAVGFIHGVMNTDNMSIACETIDFGPCAFMDEFQSNKVFSSIDKGGRYAFCNQPNITHWNLVQLANALLPLIDSDKTRSVQLATEVIDEFPEIYTTFWKKELLAKFGISTPISGDMKLCEQFLQILEQNQSDFTLTFRQLASCLKSSTSINNLAETISGEQEVSQWFSNWQSRLKKEHSDLVKPSEIMSKVNPAIIPRNHQIEQAIQQAINGQYTNFQKLYDSIQRPYEDLAEFREFQEPPQENERVRHTFCGT